MIEARTHSERRESRSGFGGAPSRTTADKLQGQWRLISRAVVAADPSDGGTVARFDLEPALLIARASQQGLLDPSLEAAASDPRVLAALARCVEAVNADLPRAERITRFEVAGAEPAAG